MSQAVPDGDRDRARGVYRTLVEDGADPFVLAFAAREREEDAAERRHLEDGAAQGDPRACPLLAWQHSEAALASAADVAATVDNHEACRARALEAGHDVGDDTYAAGLLADLEAEVRAGSAVARALRDSLEADGVFRRHPRLRPLVAGA